MTAVIETYVKDPNAVLEYSINWRTKGWLAADESIEESEWFVASGDVEIGVAEYAATTDGEVCTVWLSEGTDATDAIVTNRITTDSDPPRIDDRSIKIKVRHR